MNLNTSANNHSPYLYRPEGDQLFPMARTSADPRASPIAQAIHALLSTRDYPCVAALTSHHKSDYQVGIYGQLGSGTFWRELRQDLLFFLAQQRQTGSTYLTFWAVFEPEEFTEESFETALWKELSWLTSEEDRASDWPDLKTADPNDPAFRFALGGSEFFVVGLHGASSRRGRRFPRPTLIFNVFDQFAKLQALGQYESMVKTNRERDRRFQGDVNPMVEAHAEKWESIQFSGRNNSNQWKCPFAFLKKAFKG